MPDSYQLLAALLKKADMLKHLRGRVESGLSISEVQAELLEDLGKEYGLC